MVPEVLISSVNNQTILTYTVEKAQFEMEKLNQIINYFENTQVDTTERETALGNVTRMEDIYVDEWKDLVSHTIEQLDKDQKVVLARRRLIKFDKPISIPYVLNRALNNEKNSYLFILESNQSVFFSQTPEQLLKVEDGVLSTKAVAGTIPRTQDAEKDEKMFKHFYKTVKI